MRIAAACTVQSFLTCFVQLINNSQFADSLTGEDETALQYLKNLTVEEYEDPKSGCKISFVGADTAFGRSGDYV